MSQEEMPPKGLQDVIDAILDTAPEVPDAPHAFKAKDASAIEETTWVEADTPLCDLTSEY